MLGHPGGAIRVRCIFKNCVESSVLSGISNWRIAEFLQ
jgi:hypothetical protein